jgi:hypothetical protein
MYIVSVIVRLAWSLTVGLFAFFPIGLVLFLLLDIFVPTSNLGYRVLNTMYKIGSLGTFKGLRMEQDEFEINVEKRRSASK